MSEKEMTIYEKLFNIQQELKAPKNQYNSFGKYHYRSLEDIETAVKPLLNKYGLTLTFDEDIILVGERYYVKATAQLMDNDSNGIVCVSAFAREQETKKGMDMAQITGACSSYARKYAANGLFAIDDTKDADSQPTNLVTPEQVGKMNKIIEDKQIDIEKFLEYMQVDKLENIPHDKAKLAFGVLNKAKGGKNETDQ